MKKFILLVIALALVTIFMPQNNAMAANDVFVTVNGEIVQFPDQQPVIENGRTLVPLRFVSEALGCKVTWENNTAGVKRGGVDIAMSIGSKTPVVNGNTKTLDAPAKLTNGRTMVPLRFVSECLGAKVDWDKENRLVVINDTGGGEGAEQVSSNNDYSGMTFNKPEFGGGGTDTTPPDPTPPVPWEQAYQEALNTR